MILFSLHLPIAFGWVGFKLKLMDRELQLLPSYVKYRSVESEHNLFERRQLNMIGSFGEDRSPRLTFKLQVPVPVGCNANTEQPGYGKHEVPGVQHSVQYPGTVVRCRLTNLPEYRYRYR